MVTAAKRSVVGIELVRRLAYEGDRVFTIERAAELAPLVGLKRAYLPEALHRLGRTGWIVPLRRGLYALASTVPGAIAAHEFEIAMALVEPAAISHWSALHHHGKTEQIPRTVFVLTTSEALVPRSRRTDSHPAGARCVIAGTEYRFVQVPADRYFGIEQVWVGERRVWMTDLERTLLDGLSQPRHFGGFAEVVHGFRQSLDDLDMDRLREYARRLDGAVVKRLGWVLEHLDVVADDLASVPIKGYRKLDASSPGTGPRNRRWRIQENVPGLLAA